MEDNRREEVQCNNDLERRLVDAFEVFDHTNSNMVDIREIGTIIRALGCCPSEAEIQEILVKIENPGSPGSVRLKDFLPFVVDIITEHKFQPASPEQLLEAFHVLDREGLGYLSKEQISALMTQDGEPFTQDELDEMLEIAIDPHTQTVPYEYYINQLMYEPEGEKNTFSLADRVESEKPPPPPPPKRVSEILAEAQRLQNEAASGE